MGRESGLARAVAAGVAAALTTAVLTGCSLFGLEGEPAVECAGEAPPSTAPGDASVLLTIAAGATAWDLTTVIYADGTVALLDDHEAPSASAALAAGPPGRQVDGPYLDDPGSWHAGYLLPCAMDQMRGLAGDALFDSPDFGRVAIVDHPWTYVSYDDGASRAAVEVYAFDSGITEGLDWPERRARERLVALTDFLATNIVSTTDEVPITRAQVDGTGEVGEDFTWPGPPVARLLGEEGCGVLRKEPATAVLEFAREGGLGDARAELTVRALPPGVHGCR